MARERCGLGGDAFHHVAVARDHVGPMIDELAAEARGEDTLGERHADGVAEPLTERPGRGLDARGHAVLGMAGSDGVELAELSDVVHAERIAA